MFDHVSNTVPKILADELLRLARIDRNWLEYEDYGTVLGGMQTYKATCKYSTWLKRFWTSGSDAFSMWGTSIWLVDGPKVFRPTPEQCAALSQIEVRIELGDYTQPYPAILIDLPPGYEPFKSALCYKSPHVLVIVLNSHGNKNDITTTVSTDGRPIEVSLLRFDADCSDLAVVSSKVLRIACNACLALSSYDTTADYLYPKDVERDAHLAKKEPKSDRGKRAKERADSAPILVRFKQDIVLHRTVQAKVGDGVPTGREMASHWRRGHWAMQAHGPAHSLRKRILRPPVFVRADKFIGDVSDTKVTYTTKEKFHAEATSKTQGSDPTGATTGAHTSTSTGAAASPCIATSADAS